MSIQRCIKPFAVAQKGGRMRVVRYGDLIDSSDPLYKGREAKFESVETAVQGGRPATVEQATAAPGEKRSVSKPPAKKTAATKPDDED